MKKHEHETRGRPRDSIYVAVADDIKAHVKKHPSQKVREWVYHILRENDPLPLDNRYQGFRQSSTYKELRDELKAEGYTLSLSLVDGFDVTLKVVKASEG